MFPWGMRPLKSAGFSRWSTRPDPTWNVSPLPHGEAVLTLLKNTPHYLAELPDMVDVFQRAVAGAACFSGNRDEAVPAVDHILQLVGSSA